jgi:hypothetical protein
MLLPTRTDTRWFHDLIMQSADEVRLVSGRLWFVLEDVKEAAPFPSMVIVFRKDRRLSLGGYPQFSTFGKPPDSSHYLEAITKLSEVNAQMQTRLEALEGDNA